MELQDAGKPQEPSLKDRFSKLGAGVGAALGSIIQQDHGRPAASGVSKPEASGSTGETVGETPTGPTKDDKSNAPKTALEYFEEYEITFTSKPEFSVVEGLGGKGTVVSWMDDKSGDDASVTSNSGTGAARVPPSGAVILTVNGESVEGAEVEDVVKLLIPKDGDGVETGASGEKPESSSIDTTPGGPDEAGLKLIVRFREKTGPRQEGAAGGGPHGGEMFRNRMKAMATGIGNLFQAKDPSGSTVRDGSDAPGGGASSAVVTPAAALFDSYILTFKTEGGTADDLPFTMTEMIGGGGAIVIGVKEDYALALVQPNEEGVFTAGMTAMADGPESPHGQQLGGGTIQEELAPGAVLLRVAGKNVEGMKIGHVRKELEAAAAEHSVVRAAVCCLILKYIWSQKRGVFLAN